MSYRSGGAGTTTGYCSHSPGKSKTIAGSVPSGGERTIFILLLCGGVRKTIGCSFLSPGNGIRVRASARRARDSSRGTTTAGGSVTLALTPNRSVSLVDVPFEDVTAIKRASGATVNDVVLAAVTGGFRRLLDGHGFFGRQVILHLPSRGL